MGVNIVDNTSQIVNQLSIKASLFLRESAEDMVRISTPKTPKKTGRLRMDINKQVLGLKGTVKWGKHYGKYQETRQFKNYTTPNTGPHFAENSARETASGGNTEKNARRVGLI